MPDIATISAFLGSIKTATDIAKAIKNADSSLEKAELKLKIAELMESLADVKIQAAEIRELVQEKDEEIKHLRNFIGERERLIQSKTDKENFLGENIEAATKILIELDDKDWAGTYEHFTWECLCEITGEEEATIKVILDCLIDEEFFNIRLGEHSFRRILGTTPKARRFIFEAKQKFESLS